MRLNDGTQQRLRERLCGDLRSPNWETWAKHLRCAATGIPEDKIPVAQRRSVDLLPAELAAEQWRGVVGFDGLYDVSDHGRIRSRDREVNGKNGGMRPVVGQIIDPRVDNLGYCRIALWKEGSPSHLLVHRLVLEAFVGPNPEDQECRHLDGNPTNNRLPNLRWGTCIENSADREAHGRTPRGSTSGKSKLTEAIVAEMLLLIVDGMSLAAIARRYGVRVGTVSFIYSGATWKHVPRPANLPKLTKGCHRIYIDAGRPQI